MADFQTALRNWRELYPHNTHFRPGGPPWIPLSQYRLIRKRLRRWISFHRAYAPGGSGYRSAASSFARAAAHPRYRYVASNRPVSRGNRYHPYRRPNNLSVFRRYRPR